MKHPSLTTRRTLLQAGGGLLLGGLAGGLGSCRRPPALLSETELLEAPPALFRPAERGCTLHWIPRTEIESRIVVGAEPHSLDVVYEGRSGRPTTATIELTSPQPAELRFQYRGSGRREWAERRLGPVRLGRRRGESFRVALVADSHIYHALPRALENFQKTLEWVARDNPDFVIFLGDEAGVHSFRDRRGASAERAGERWRFWRHQCAELLSAYPSFMVLGNHEGEAGFYRRHERAGVVEHLQRWGTVARKRHFLNPGPATYPEGGEDEKWRGEEGDPAVGDGSDGNASPLENYFALSWGDALFVVLDVYRYTNEDGPTPRSVDDWSLGSAQMRWLERVLKGSEARWKFVLAHHLVGGSEWDLAGRSTTTDYKYGRGGAKYAMIGSQARITTLMRQTGAQAFLYGHDHIFSTQTAHDVRFVCCGRATIHSRSDLWWWRGEGWREAYGEHRARDPHDFHAAIGFARLEVGPKRVLIQYVRTAEERGDNVTAPVGSVVHEMRLA